jgi:ankyrin repeat protein
MFSKGLPSYFTTTPRRKYSAQVSSEKSTKSHWRVNRLRNSTNYLENIIPPQDQTVDLSKPKLILSFENQKYNSPIKEAVFAWHPEGYLSSLIYARMGVSQKLYSLFKQRTFVFYDRRDPHPRIGFTKNLNNLEEKAQAKSLIDSINSIAPFDEHDWSYIQDLLNEPVTQSKAEQLVIDAKTDKPYFTSINSIPFGGNVEQYDDRYDRIIPTDIPAIHQAILAADAEVVEFMLQNNPCLANSKDPSGKTAHELAHSLGLLSILKSCFDARQVPGVMTGQSDFDQQKRYDVILKKAAHDGILDLPWLEQIREISYSMIICFPKKTVKDPIAYFAAQKDKYYERIESAKQNKRSALHQACIDGNLSEVKAILADRPDLLERTDILGFKPLLLAMANKHEALVDYLIKQNASLDSYDYNNTSFRAIDNVTTPAMMELLLHHHEVSLSEFNSRLADAVRANDFDMVRIILFYLNKLPQNNVGQTPFDLAVKWADKNDLKILDFFLKYWTLHVPEGPYDTTPFKHVPEDPIITPEMEELFVAHNKRIDAREKRKKIGTTLIKPSQPLDGNRGIETLIYLDGRPYRSEIKPAHFLSEEEIKELESKPEIFKFLGENARTQPMYFRAMLLEQKTDADRQFYVDIWTDEQGSITNFFSFDVERMHHSQHGDLILFHGKLACNFAPIGLSDLNFQRISASLAKLNPKTPTYVFFRAIPPGYGMSYIPSGISYYPKTFIPEELVSSIFATKGIKIENRIVGTDVNARTTPPFFQLPQEYHRYMTKGQTDKAVPVCYHLREQDLPLVEAKLAAYGFTDMQSFTECWGEFEAQNYNTYRAKL